MQVKNNKWLNNKIMKLDNDVIYLRINYNSDN